MTTKMSTTKEEKVLWDENASTEAEKSCLNNNEQEQSDITNGINNDSTERLWSDIGKVSGIYKIINRTNGNYYVGSAKNISIGCRSRWCKHKSYLRNNRHPNPHLQNAWNKYGEENFMFVVEAEVPEEELVVAEQKYLDIAFVEQEKSYNMCFTANGPFVLSEESKKKKVEKIKAYWSSPSAKENASKKHMGKMLTEKHREILRQCRLGSKCHWYGKKQTLEQMNYRIVQTIHVFRNKRTGEVFEGRRYDFGKKYDLNQGHLHGLVNKNPNIKSIKGWILVR